MSEGFGHFEYVNGTVYDGQWIEIDGKKFRQGQGKLIHSGTTVYEKGNEEYNGNWVRDKMEGYGVYKYTSGAIYSGEWKDNKHEGRGIYEFPDGSIYDGQWKNSKLHGEGVYIDREGNKWEGEFVEGVFQSKMQKVLKNEKAVKQKEAIILTSVSQIFAKFIQAYNGSDKKTYRDNLGQFFVTSDEAASFIKEVSIKYESYVVEKWFEIIQLLQEQGRPNVLRASSSSNYINPDFIIAKQLNGPGQIVEYSLESSERQLSLVFLNFYEENWLIVAVNDTKK